MYKGSQAHRGYRPTTKIIPPKKPSKPTTIPYRDFAEEIMADLPALMKEYPEGLYAHALKAYYGESNHRVFAALNYLMLQGRIDLRMAPDRTYYIVHPDYPVHPLIELTDLQKKVVNLFLRTCVENNTDSIRTGYSQLIRVLGASMTGIQNCIRQLEDKGYLIMAGKPEVGMPASIVLRCGPALKKVLDDHKKTS